MAATLREHLLQAGWAEATVEHVLEAIKASGTDSQQSADSEANKIAQDYGRHDLLAQLAAYRGEIPAAALMPTPAEGEAVTLKSGAFLVIHDCYSCHERHDHVAVTPYRTDNSPWTHWYACPTNGDPVPMTIQVKGENPVEVCRRIMRDVDEALAAGSLMSAIFYVGRDGKLKMRWMTDKFPFGYFDETSRLLAEHNAKNGGITKPVEPLPRAQPHKQVFKVPEELFRQQPPGPGNGEIPIVGEAVAEFADDDDE